MNCCSSYTSSWACAAPQKPLSLLVQQLAGSLIFPTQLWAAQRCWCSRWQSDWHSAPAAAAAPVGAAGAADAVVAAGAADDGAANGAAYAAPVWWTHRAARPWRTCPNRCRTVAPRRQCS